MEVVSVRREMGQRKSPKGENKIPFGEVVKKSKGNPSLAQWRQQSLEWGKKSFASGQRMSSIRPLDSIAPFPSGHLADGYQVCVSWQFEV
jgi:hypothetical protein